MSTLARLALVAAAVWQAAAAPGVTCPTNTFDVQAPSIEMDTVPDQLEWIVTPTKTRVFAKSEGGSVYKSNNGGVAWTNETPKLTGTPDSGVSGADSKSVLQVITLDASPYMILQGWTDNNWATRDMGDTWIQPCGLPGVPADACFASPLGTSGGSLSSLYKLHPTLPEHVLAMVMRKACDSGDVLTSDLCGNDLMYSADLGHTWVNLTQVSDKRIAGFVDFDWAPPIPGEMDDGKPGIVATVYEDTAALADGADKSWDYNVHFVYSTDLFETAHVKLLLCGNSFEVLNGDLYVAQLRDCEAYHGATPASQAGGAFAGTDITLQISTDAGKTFKDACFPVAMSQKGYTVFDFHTTLGGPDFISVDHDEEDAAEAAAPMGNLYSSDDSLQLFSLSMRRNVRFGGAAVDFINVEGIDGIYIANQISGASFADPSFIAKKKTIDDFVHTRITYNGGGVWMPVKPPLVDVDGAPIACHAGGKCDLHLHGASHWQRGTWATRLGSVYSQPAAPGVILATGNVGEFLSNDANSVNTYLSRDAGVTWEEILRGPHIYEFGNHGGLIVAAKMASLGPTDEVLFSRDEGLCWEGPIKLARPLSVHNIRVDPDTAGSVFVIHGTDSRSLDGDPDGVVYTIDFKNLQVSTGGAHAAFVFPECDPAADYELWVPKPPGPPGACVLGRNYTMQRRRRESRCLNKQDYERTATKEMACPCDQDFDTECQFGSERKLEFGECARMKDVALTTCPALAGKELPVSNKRIIAGSKCVDKSAAVGHDTFHVGGDTGAGQGKKKGGGAGSAWLTFFLVMFFLGGAGAGGFWAYHKYDLQRFVPMEVKDAVRSLKDKVDELRGRKSPTPAGYFEPLGDFGGEDI